MRDSFVNCFFTSPIASPFTPISSFRHLRNIIDAIHDIHRVGWNDESNGVVTHTHLRFYSPINQEYLFILVCIQWDQTESLFCYMYDEYLRDEKLFHPYKANYSNNYDTSINKFTHNAPAWDMILFHNYGQLAIHTITYACTLDKWLRKVIRILWKNVLSIVLLIEETVRVRTWTYIEEILLAG